MGWARRVIRGGLEACEALIADGTLPDGFATDDGAGLLYRGTEFVEALTETDSAGAYRVVRAGDRAESTPLDVRRLS